MTRRPIRIGNSSGATGDGPDQMYRLATEGPIDAIYGDYLAELNIAWRALEMIDHPELGYEVPALTQLKWKTAAQEIASKGIRVVHDGGALNPRGLYLETKKHFEDLGLDVKVAWVEGDNITDRVKANTTVFPHLDIPNKKLDDVKNIILTANAYIGMKGIVAALNGGAQVVICGRCCDASPVMALAAWWHGWSDRDYDKFAGALMAGHVTECGPYTTGGNFCGFKAIPSLINVGYPICEISDDGSSIITKHDGTTGAVTVDTVTAQLVYEIQGPTYLNPDVIAYLEDIKIEKVGDNRIKLSGMKGSPPPSTTKLAVCTMGGYQAELYFLAVGLDIKEKLGLLRAQLMDGIDESRYFKLSLEAYGTCPDDPKSQREATVHMRQFIQAPTKEAIEDFTQNFWGLVMSGYGGFHLNMDLRTLTPKPFISYFPALVPQSMLNIKAHIDDKVISVESMTSTVPFASQDSYGPRTVTDLSTFGPTTKTHLGKVVLARSGDKGGNANVGLWVRNDDEWPWLQSFLTIDTFKYLLGDDYKPEYRIERFEMSYIRAVHFVTYGILEDGISSTSVLDGLAKSFGEFIRARKVDIPDKFLERPAVGEYLH
ncbi:hypothetical protein DFS33DRAFT_1428570 [Desarmillaria ectypa]|nr:hypothetical protein DFS33DRAFT_1428570 [Desarmillaria ectypa]